MQSTSKLFLFVCLLVLVGLWSGSTAFAQDSAELETYVDQLLAEEMPDRSIPGLTIAIVENGELVLLKGYGVSNIESQTPIDPERDLFRIGSLTKTFTFTALMQLVEKGQIDLNAEVNDYLSDLQMPETHGKPMLVRDLISHRTGFEDVWRDRAIESETYYRSFEEWLEVAMPRQAFPPGEVTGYSNYGPTLAGYLIQEISGVPYDDYMRQNILTPLSMESTTTSQPLSADHQQAMDIALRDRLATTYQVSPDGQITQFKEEILVPRPAGGISTTASDMSRYMRAHLGEGAFDSARILETTTVDAMRKRLYNDRNSPDIAHGFVNGELGGYETYGHDGATFVAYSAMLMIPELDIGIFIGTNGGNNVFGPSQLAHEIGHHMVGDRINPAPATITLPEAELEAYTGSYMTNLRSYGGFFKVLGAILGTAEVTVTPQNTLNIADQYATHNYAPLSKTEFVNVDTGGLITFVLEDDSPVSYFTEDGLSMFSRITFSNNIVFLLVGIVLALIFGSTQIIAVVRQRAMRGATDQMTQRLWLLRAVAAAAVLLSIMLLVYGFIQFQGLGDIALSVRPIGMTLFYLSVLFVLLMGLFVFAGLLPILRSNAYTGWGKMHYLLFAASLVFFLVQLNNWNMIGFNYF